MRSEVAGDPFPDVAAVLVGLGEPSACAMGCGIFGLFFAGARGTLAASFFRALGGVLFLWAIRRRGNNNCTRLEQASCRDSKFSPRRHGGRGGLDSYDDWDTHPTHSSIVSIRHRNRVDPACLLRVLRASVVNSYAFSPPLGP